MLGLCFFVQAFSCAWGKGLLIVMVSHCCRAQAPGWAGLSSCGAWAGHVAPSQTRGQTCVLCAVSQILIHCTTREVLQLGLNLQSWGQKTPFGACDFLFFIGCPLRLVGFYFQSPNCPLEVRACSLNHWSNRKFPCDFFFFNRNEVDSSSGRPFVVECKLVQCTVRPNKPWYWRLEQRKVYCRGQQGEWVTYALKSPMVCREKLLQVKSGLRTVGYTTIL